MATVGLTSIVHGQTLSPQTPKGWSYDVDVRGNRVARDMRITHPDGSWREETHQGNCLTIKERSKTGEYRETRQCNPVKPGQPLTLRR